MGTGSERALGVCWCCCWCWCWCWCSAPAAPPCRPSPSAWTRVRGSNPDTCATSQHSFLRPGKRLQWAILLVPTRPMRSNWLVFSFLGNGCGLGGSHPLWEVTSISSRKVGGGGRQLVALQAPLLAPRRPTAAAGPQPLPSPPQRGGWGGGYSGRNSQIKEETKIQGGAAGKSGLVTCL